MGAHGGSERDFDEALDATRAVPGFLTDGQARRLWERASRVPAPGTIVEIGSHYGRSTVLLALAAADGVRVLALDPHASGPYASASDAEGERIHAEFHANLDSTGVADRVEHVRAPSQSPRALERAPVPVQMVYVDGDHRYRLARADIRLWGGRLDHGGGLFVHDVFSSPYVTAAVVRTLWGSRRFRYVGRERSLVEFEATDASPGEAAADVLRQASGAAWLVRNIAIKLAIKAGAPWLARALGHRGPGWPY
jgi:predicted O-methyltransferase YrrM